ncbi:MAG: D-sedoheptulose 7-phosphate isomerase [Deltaproteobacteria bacterium]|nr:D-sedoheptulose 7-phosphate isomerase [Deltaproteobacteria bacterium]
MAQRPVNDLNQLINKRLKDLQDVQNRFLEIHSQDLIDLAFEISQAFSQGKKIMIMGNGGSAADAQHMAAEFVNRFKIERPPLPALSLSTDTSILTAIGNDYGYDQVFEKQILALGVQGDILLGISTSGNSSNILRGFKAGRGKKIKTVALTGNEGGAMIQWADKSLIVPSSDTPHIQETHILAIHLLCELVDSFLFPTP